MPEGYAGVFSPSIINIPRLAVLQSPASLKKRFKSIVSYLKPEGLKNVPQNTITESVISRTSIRLSSLPAELLLMIISHLDIVNQVCLQITCRFFRAFIIVDRVALENDRCRKWALTCFLEGDMDKYPAKVACAFCKTVRPKNQFLDFRHELGIWDNLRHPSVFRQKYPDLIGWDPVNRYCCQHRKNYFSRNYPIRTSDGRIPGGLREDQTPRWLICQVFRCWHCASVIRVDDKRKAGCLNCLCDFCPRLKRFHHFRVGTCQPGQGQYKWEGLCDVKIGKGQKKKIRGLCVREIGGQVVPTGRVREHTIFSF